MKKYLFIALFLFLLPSLAVAAITLPYSTTFDCIEWEAAEANDPNMQGDCDEWYYGVHCTCSGGQAEQITSDANYTGGGGGRGKRHWRGSGKNDNSCSPSVTWTGDAGNEVWYRFYIRYQTGTSWTSNRPNEKILYLHDSDEDFVQVRWSWGSAGILNNSTVHYHSGTNTDWTNYITPGSWHLYEVYIKLDTDGTDGVITIWIDSTQVYTNSAVDYKAFDLNGVRTSIPTNGMDCTNASCLYEDIDDFAISATARIGAVGGDVSAPLVESAAIGSNGTTVTIVFSETVVTTGYDNGDFDLDCTTAGNNISLNSISGSGGSRTFTAASTIYNGDTCNLDYTGGANEIEDAAGNDLAQFSDDSVTNNSGEIDSQPGTAWGLSIN